MIDERDDDGDVETDAPYCLWSGEYDDSDLYCRRDCEYRVECRQIQEAQEQEWHE